MKLYSNRKHVFPRLTRITAIVTLGAMIFGLFLPGPELLAQTFESFDQKSKDNLDNYLNRAERLESEEEWSNYVELGIATERAQWESEAYDELQNAYNEINNAGGDEDTRNQKKEEARAKFDAARKTWQEEAENLFQEERGRFEARGASIDIAAVAVEEYEDLILAAEAAMAGLPDTDLSGWTAAIGPGHQALIDAFEAELATQMADARNEHSDLTGVELAAFEDEISAIEDEVEAEFYRRDNFFLVRARNRYIALKRSDEVSARLAMDQTSADAVFDAVVGKTISELDTETDSVIQSAIDETQAVLDVAGGDINAVGPNWNDKVEALIQSGLRKWELAEEDLFARRLAWREEAKSTKEAANEIWENNHKELQAAMENWLEKVEEQALEGRKQWQSKITEFENERRKSEEELAEYIDTQREQWLASSQQLGGLVNGGGSALLEAKDAYRFYQEQIALREAAGNCGGSICTFYRDQMQKMGQSIASFQSILLSTEGVMDAQMNSDEGHTGLLNDRRMYAGDLPAQVAAIPTGDYRNDLTTTINAQDEDFLLYRRDLLNLVDRNKVFTDRAAALDGSNDFNYNATTSLEDLTNMVGEMDQKYDRHALELARILDEEREGTDAEKLALIKTDIDDWFTVAVDENVRLKEQTVAYFNDGLGSYLLSDQTAATGDGEGSGGFYTTGDQNDPYLMTQAEYEWELLRRERNYLAKKLRRAEEVKHYADLAFQHEAGLELAAITNERAVVAKAHADLKEIIHELISGNVPIAPELKGAGAAPGAVANRADELLAERGIDYSALTLRAAQIDQERTLMDTVAGFATGPDVATTDGLINDIDVYLDGRQLTGEERADHPLNVIRGKLVTYRDAVVAGDPAPQVADRWTALRSAAGISASELVTLKDSYNFPGIDADRQRIIDLIPAKNINDYQGDMDGITAQIEANSNELRDATDRLQEAKENYHNAFVDYQVLLSSEGSAELIRAEISQTTDKLSTVLNRMVKVEESSGLCDTGGALGSCVQDVVSKETIEYLNEVSESERAKEEFSRASSMLGYMQGLEAAKARAVEVERVITDNTFTGLSPEQIADIWIAEEANLVDRDSTEEDWRSESYVLDAMDALKAGRTYLTDRQAALALEQAEPTPDPVKIQTITREISEQQEQLMRSVELLIAGTRGEVTRRRNLALYLLENVDGSGDPLVRLDQLADQQEAENETLADLGYDLAERASARLDSFLTTNRERSFADIMQTLNDTIAALPPRTLDTSLTGYGSAAAASPGVRAEWLMVRQWVAASEDSIDNANKAPDNYDPRQTAERWDEILKTVSATADDATFHRTFDATIPTSANDPRMVVFQTGRQNLAAQVDGVLAEIDANLMTAYQALSAADRETLETYAAVDPENPRQGLLAMKTGIESDLLRLPRQYKEIFLREEARAQAEVLRNLEPDLQEKSGRLSADRMEKADLEKDRADLLIARAATAVPAEIAAIDAQIAQIDARLPVLDARIAVLEPDVTALEDQARAASNVLREATRPGSTSRMYTMARSELYGYNRGAENLAASVQLMSNVEYARDFQEEDPIAPTDQIKGILGIYQTDVDGTVMRDASGVGIPAGGFEWAGLDPHADLTTLMGGNSTGSQLETWVGRLQEWSRDESRSADAPREVRAAIEMLEESMREYLAAREFIEVTRLGMSAQDIAAQAADDAREAEWKLLKLTRLVDLERKLAGALQEAEANGGDAVNAALAVLETEENTRLLFMFEGYDPEGVVDGITDSEIQSRLDEMRTLTERLRDARIERTVANAAANYGAYQEQNLLYVNDPTVALWPNGAEFFANFPSLDGQSVQDDMDALALSNPTNYREVLFDYIADIPEEKRIFGGEIASLLARDQSDGLALKNAVDAAMTALRTRVEDDLAAYASTVDVKITRHRDLEVETSVVDLLDDYSQRGDNARAAMIPELDAITMAMDALEVKDGLAAKADALLPDAIYTTVREDIHRILNEDYEVYTKRLDEIAASGDSVAQQNQDRETARISFILSTKSRIAGSLYALPELTAADRVELSDELYARELGKSVALSDVADEFVPEDYPTELHDFILVRQYTRAEERYADYLALRASDTDTERERASLDLSGINGEFAEHILARDFADYLAGNSLTAFLSGGEGRRTIDEYLNGFYQDRNTGPEALPNNGELLREIVSLMEYRRIQTEATAAGGLHLVDESGYFNDMLPYLMAAKFKDFATRNALVLPPDPATADAKKAYLQPHFATFLADPLYQFGGQSIGDRMPAVEARDGLFALFYGDLAESPAIEQYLPLALADRRLNGRLDEDPPPALSYLPEELLNITNYTTLDYRTLASNVSDQTRAALARIETREQATREDLSLALTDLELGTIVDRAGHGSLPLAVRTDLIEMLRNTNERVRLGAASDTATAYQSHRRQKLIDDLFPTREEQRQLNAFMTANQDLVTIAEGKLFAELAKRDDGLKEQAKLHRGDFFRALIEHHRALTAGGSDTPFYNSLGTLQPEMDLLYDRLFASGQNKLEDEDIAALLANADMLEKVFDMRSGEELVTSGVFESLETGAFAALSRSADDAMLAEARTKRVAVARDYAELIFHVENGGDPAAFVPASGIAGLGPHLIAALEAANPTFKKQIRKEKPLLDRMMNNYLETQAERDHIDALLRDSSLTDPDSKYRPRFETDQAAALANIRETELATALIAMIGDHTRAFDAKSLELSRQQATANSLKKFARDRGGDDANFTESRFAHYRTFIGAEKEEQVRIYRSYVDGLVTESDAAENLGSIDTPDGPRTAELRGYLTAIDSTLATGGWPAPPSGVKGFSEYFSGRVLETDSMGLDAEAEIMSGNWQQSLTSDDPGATAGTVAIDGDPGDPLDDITGSVRRIKTVQSMESLAGGAQPLRGAYFASLANNYLESLSGLNAALNNVFTAAKMAGARESTETRDEFLARMRSAYDASATTAASVTNLQNLQVEAQTKMADHDETKIATAQNEINSQRLVFSKAGDSFAQAARRRFLESANLDGYIRTVMATVDQELQQAQQDVWDLEDTATTLRTNYNTAISAYTDTMNAMGDAYREFTRENEEFELRQAVKEWADTPYLFSFNTEEDETKALEDQRGDADREFELALAAYENVQEQLSEAGYNVMIQDDLGRLNRLATVLGGTDTVAIAALNAPLNSEEREELFDLRERAYKDYENLTAAETTRLEELTDREMFERYEELLLTRQEHIAHTMRMVRMQKASEIISPEIERRRAKAEQKRKELEEALDRHFGVRSEHAENEDAIDSRNAVYMRLSGVVASGGDLYNEYRSWYWGRNSYLESMFNGYAESAMWGQPVMPSIWPTQIMEGQVGMLIAAGMPGADRHMLNKWMDYGGTFAEFGNFSGVYYSFMQSLGVHDMMKMEKEVVTAIQSVVMGMGATLIASGTAAMATIIGAAAGAAQIAFGQAMVRGAMKQIAQAQLKHMVAQIYAIIMQLLAHQSAQDTTAIREIDVKRAEYEEAQAELEYFTKVPDLNTLKNRVIQYGAARADDPNEPAAERGAQLFQVTTEDLRYLVETDIAGTPIYDPALSTEEQAEALDVSVKKRLVEYRDAFGRRYDPTITSGSIDRMEGGLYWDDEMVPTGNPFSPFAPARDPIAHVKTRNVNDAGFLVGDKYNLMIEDNDPRTHQAYDMGEVLTLAVAHGSQLRDDRKQRYLEAGDDLSDQSFVLHERESVMGDLFTRAADRDEGGREFSGYRRTYQDYSDNADDVFARELEQRRTVQTKEWDLREQELRDAAAAWDAKMELITKRGREAWAGALDRFASRWRQWERDYDQEVADGEAEWATRVTEHFTEKSDWEAQMRTEMQQATVQNTLDGFITNLNDSIAGLNAYSGTTFDKINRLATVSTILDELKQGEPGRLERLKRINENIDSFNTNLSISEMSSGDFISGNASVTSRFNTEMRSHQDRIKIVTNVKAFEQYRLVLDKLREQINQRNEAIQKQTTAAAYSAGFVMMGGVFVKAGGRNSSYGVVNPYQFFDGEKAIGSELERVGLKEGEFDYGNLSTAQLLSEGSGLVDFLEKRSSTEVSSFFYVQQLAIQTVTDRIMGRGRASERKTSTDTNVIGSLGAWIGRAPNSTLGKMLKLAGNKEGWYRHEPEHRDLVYEYGLAGGFGELGSGTLRPSGITFGFYVQLQEMSRYVQKQDAELFANEGETLDPISTTLQQVNPLVMYGNSYQNVMLSRKYRQHRLDKSLQSGAKDFKSDLDGPGGVFGTGKSKWDIAGYHTDPFAKLAGENGMYAGGQSLLFMDKHDRHMWEAQMLASFKGVLGIIDQGYISSAIKVDTRTGERSFKYTEEDQDRLKDQFLFGSVFAERRNAGREYDENGRYIGSKSSGGRDNTASLIRATIGSIPIIGKSFGEYAVRQTAGREYSSYDSLYKPDLGALSNVVSLILLLLAAAESGGGSALKPAEGSSASSSLWSNLANEFGQANSAADMLRGLGEAVTNAYRQHGRQQWTSLRQSLFLEDKFKNPLLSWAGVKERALEWSGFNDFQNSRVGGPLLDLAGSVVNGLIEMPGKIRDGVLGLFKDGPVDAPWKNLTGKERVAEFSRAFSKFKEGRESSDQKKLLESFLEKYKTSDVIQRDPDGLFRMTVDTSSWWNLLGTQQERYEFIEGQEPLNTIKLDTNPLKTLFGMGEATINGKPLADGDGIYRGTNNVLQVIKQDQVKSFLKGKVTNSSQRMLFTQNGVNNTALQALEMSDVARNSLNPQILGKGADFVGTMHVYNMTRTLPVDVANLFGSYLMEGLGLGGFENSYDTWTDIIDSGVLKHGGVVAAHSQGGQIVTHAFHNRIDTKTNAQLILMGGAHYHKPENVAFSYDLRNSPDFITGTLHELGDLADPAWGQNHQYSQHYNFETTPNSKTTNWNADWLGIRHGADIYGGGIEYLMNEKKVDFFR